MRIFKYVTIILICISLVAFLAYPTSQQKFTLERILQIAENAPTGAFERVRAEILNLEPPKIKTTNQVIGAGTIAVITKTSVYKVIDGINEIINALWFIGESTIFTGALLYDAIHLIGYFIMELI